MVPEYEVRLQLNPAAVLGPDYELTGTVLSTFGIHPIKHNLNIQFLDTSSKELYIAGWSARICKTENEDGFELTYKKRYTISGGNIDAALAAANNDGFNAGIAKYEAQVEWGYEKQTLSVSRKKALTDSGSSGLDLPGTSDSRKMLISEAPHKFDNWISNKWGTSILAKSQIFGPVLVGRSIGSWNKIPLYLEVWPLLNLSGTGIDYIVEASFKTENRDTASIERTNLAAFLEYKGWFLADLLNHLLMST
ncbi:hypothetical protein BDV34DRAFT_233374 [Aspergillus parasiticus]|uniref:Uncharacterized protein n=1 Tax=Aspergillus parasiticus TaxID=5067 RepID=A0A5N6D4U3_ASPPA|nr:hypothetical protein BDV34DRAFT_233374 [Aspergillus parasiticus]